MDISTAWPKSHIHSHMDVPMDISMDIHIHGKPEFRGEVNRQETRIMGLSSSEDRMIVAGVVLA